MNKTELLDRCARSGEERVLLARVLDKLEPVSYTHLTLPTT